MIAAEKCLQLWVAMKLHFTSEKYDAVESKCRTNGTYDSAKVNKRHDAAKVRALSKQFGCAPECASFMAANAAYGNMYPFDDFEKSWALFTKWKKIRWSITKVFRDDLDTIASYGVSYKELLDASSDVPKLFYLAKAGKISIETIVILNRYDNFLDTWKANSQLWKAEMLRIGKLDKFVKFDPAKIEPLIATFKEELGTENAQV